MRKFRLLLLALVISTVGACDAIDITASQCSEGTHGSAGC